MYRYYFAKKKIFSKNKIIFLPLNPNFQKHATGTTYIFFFGFGEEIFLIFVLMFLLTWQLIKKNHFDHTLCILFKLKFCGPFNPRGHVERTQVTNHIFTGQA